MTTQTTVSLITEDLRAVKRRVGLGFVYLQTNRANPNLFHLGRTRLTAIVVQDYLPALKAMLAQHGRETVAERHAHVESRIGNGSSYLGAPAGQKIDDGYIELVNEYEILWDALCVGQHPDTFLNRFFDRIEGIQHTPQQAVSQ